MGRMRNPLPRWMPHDNAEAQATKGLRNIRNHLDVAPETKIIVVTHADGVDIPDFLKEQYPEEMTIIIQHQYWALKVKDDYFEVTLTFKKLPAPLHIPFNALTAFFDPGVQFGLHGGPFRRGPGVDAFAVEAGFVQQLESRAIRRQAIETLGDALDEGHIFGPVAAEDTVHPADFFPAG